MNLYEILVPTMYGWPEVKPIRTAHHKKWDEWVQKLTGGLTLLSPVKGKWEFRGVEYFERVIPVRLACSPIDIEKIVRFSLTHYRQNAIMFYLISSEVHIVYRDHEQA